MTSVRETFILKLVKFDDSLHKTVALTLRNIKSAEAVTFSSTEELAEYLDISDEQTHNERQV